MKIAVLCANVNSVYKSFPDLEVYDKNRNAYTFPGGSPIIAHPPCQQWSRLKHFAKGDQAEKDLAFFCLEMVNKYGGILEHPIGSHFFKAAGITKTYSINQSWFGFPAKKTTLLYFSQCAPAAHPLNFNAIEKRVQDLHSSKRSDTTIQFAEWLIKSVSSRSIHNES